MLTSTPYEVVNHSNSAAIRSTWSLWQRTFCDSLPYGGKLWRIYCKNILAEENLANSLHSQTKNYTAKLKHNFWNEKCGKHIKTCILCHEMLNINAVASCIVSCNRVKLDQGTRQVHVMYEMRHDYVEIEQVKCYTWATNNSMRCMYEGHDYDRIELKPIKLMNIMYACAKGSMAMWELSDWNVNVNLYNA